MNITETRIHRLDSTDKTKALASITIDDCFVVHGLKVVEGRNGLFVAMPSRKVKDEYKDIAHPITAEAREAIQAAVLGEYNGEADPFAEGSNDDLPW